MTSEIAIEIAELLVWTDIKIEDYYGACYVGHPPNSINCVPVPDYDTDRAAALELLEHMMTFRGVSVGKEMQDTGAVKFTIYTDATIVVEWSIWRGPHGYSDAKTLPLAIAIACRDALRALKQKKLE